MLRGRHAAGTDPADPVFPDTTGDYRSSCGSGPRPVVFYSDRGCQYTSTQFANLARDLGVTLSVGRKDSAGTQRRGRVLPRHCENRAHPPPRLADEATPATGYGHSAGPRKIYIN